MVPAPGAALLFDIDGTLADTDRLHLEAFNRVFGPFGETFDHDRFNAEIQGRTNYAIAARFLSALPPERQAEVMEEKEATFRDLARTGIEPLPGLLPLLDRADAAGLPFAAVTNAPRANADLIVTAIGIKHRFRAIVVGVELKHGKPHPLPYLEGLRLVGGHPELSVAFEDSPAGVTSARGAGIATIGMLTGQTEAKLQESGARFGAHDYTDPALLRFIDATVSARTVRIE
jgi:HAD superfamily hydrolase (TIGR01509 family)